MARNARRLIVIPNQPHHVILRGNNRRRIFSYSSDYRFFLHKLYVAGRKYGVATHAISLMTNHVHLVVSPTACDALSQFVKGTAQPYAQRRNRKRSASGKLFEERFKCVPIVSEEQMAITTVYVELNAVRAGLCRKAIEHRWSTHAMHVGQGASDEFVCRAWTPSSWYRSLGTDSKHRRVVYANWFEHYRRRDEWTRVANERPAPADQKRLERPDRRPAG